MASGEPIGLLLALTQASAGAGFSPHKIETITVSESVTVRLVSFVNVNDSVTVTESTSVSLLGFVAVSETVTVSESLTAVVVNNFLGITVSDSVTVSESTKLLQTSFINKTDTISVTEAVSVLGVLLINRSETVTVSELVTMSLGTGRLYLENGDVLLSLDGKLYLNNEYVHQVTPKIIMLPNRQLAYKVGSNIYYRL